MPSPATSVCHVCLGSLGLRVFLSVILLTAEQSMQGRMGLTWQSSHPHVVEPQQGPPGCLAAGHMAVLKTPPADFIGAVSSWNYIGCCDCSSCQCIASMQDDGLQCIDSATSS